MTEGRILKSIAAISGAAVLAGCVVDPGPLSVAPGQGKSYADFQRDDAACRGSVATPGPIAGATTPSTQSTAAAPPQNYYQCMQSRGDLVVATRDVPYPVYAPSYPVYPAAYPYGYGYGYPSYGYGYPYGLGYAAPYVGLGIGIGIGSGFYGRGYYGRGYYGHGGFGGYGHGGFGGYGHGGFGGGGFGRGGGGHR